MPAEIGFSISPTDAMMNQPLSLECTVITSASLVNPMADITWLGPDGTIMSVQTVAFLEMVDSQGNAQNMASLELDINQFTPDTFGEYRCIALVRSDSFPNTVTGTSRSIQIPSSGKFISNTLTPI